MLLTRIITALVLLAVLLPALFAASPVPFIALTLAFSAAAAWEWARLNGVAGTGALATGGLCAVLCAGLWGAGAVESALPVLWIAVGVAWVLGGIWLLGRGVAGWPRLPPGSSSAIRSCAWATTISASPPWALLKSCASWPTTSPA